MTATMNKNLAAAIEYADIGWHVLPLHTPGPNGCSCGNPACSSAGKHPRTPNGLQDATDELAILMNWWSRWPDANVGIATGEPSGIVVIDIDPGAEIGDLCDEHGQFPETVEADTGRGGMHLIFVRSTPVRNSAGRLAPHVDVRGDGGYIVAAPSLHASGRRYAWRLGQSPMERKPAELPEWILKKLEDKQKLNTSQRHASEGMSSKDLYRKLLGRALANATGGTRNEQGFWLACQLRDNGASEREAESVLSEYADRVPRGDAAYTQAEATASVRSAYTKSARDAWKSEPKTNGTPKASATAPAKSNGSSDYDNLIRYMHDVADGKIRNVPFPWPLMSKLTQGLLPGSVFTVCGDPGVGKTFFDIQSLIFWHQNGVPCSALFLEKNKIFYGRRLLAMLEEDGTLIDFDYMQGKNNRVTAADERWRDIAPEVIELFYTFENRRPFMADVMKWVDDRCAAGDRVMLIDPITSAEAGQERWTVDGEFMWRMQDAAGKHGVSIILVTHPKKGNRPGQPSGHDVAGGAAYHRNSDTNVWLVRTKKPRRVRVRRHTPAGPETYVIHADVFAQLHKTRDGRGAGQEIAYRFENMRYAELGVVLEDLKEDDE
jgi:hypothetical protein